jgi:hypothetical protein
VASIDGLVGQLMAGGAGNCRLLSRVFSGQLPVGSSLFDQNARRRTVSLTVNDDLYAKARAAGINASRVAEEWWRPWLCDPPCLAPRAD